MNITFRDFIEEFFIINTLSLLGVGIVSLISTISGNIITFDGYFPIKIILNAFLCAIPSLLFMFKEEPTKKQFIVRVLIHFIVLSIVISIAGYFFSFYDGIYGYLFFMTLYIIVYVGVWIISFLLDKKQEQSINDILSKNNKD